MVRFKDLSLEVQLHVECDKLAKEAVEGSTTKKLRDNRQQLPLEKACMFIADKKHTSEPKKDLKQQIGTVQEKAYYTSRKKKERQNGRTSL